MSNIETLTNVPIAKLSSFQNSGTVNTVYIFHDKDTLQNYIKQHSDFYVLGKGSNTIIDPNNPYAAIIRISPRLTPPHVSGNTITLSAGTSINKLMHITQNAGLSGLEFSAGVPASLGGMICMNFGCWGHEIANRVSRVHIIDEQGQYHWLTQNDMCFGYRDSIIQQHNWTIIEVELSLSNSDPDTIKQTLQHNIQTRLEEQPLRGKTFGSIFKNPNGHFAAQLIEKLMLKGVSFGTIQISDKHSNFMENCQNASFQETVDLIHTLQEKVYTAFGIHMEPEVQLVH